jgi:hypothetical protein
MAIPLDTLRKAAQRPRPQRLAKSLKEARAAAQQTAFLCHSHKDEQLAEGLQILLVENRWDVYIDWKDTTMPSQPDREAADKIKGKIIGHDWFLFLATPNSTASRWCPWELGYADMAKLHKRIILITTQEGGKWYGNEYLQLYREIDFSKSGKLCAYAADDKQRGVLLEDLR